MHIAPNKNISLTPIEIPPSVHRDLMNLASKSDVLFLGEIHGTKEIPRLVLGLLKSLEEHGYKTLALELQRSEHEALVNWAKGVSKIPPTSFTISRDNIDGKANLETVALISAALNRGWNITSVDCEKYTDSTDRDRQMAENLTTDLALSTFGTKVLAIVGRVHSRLSPPPNGNPHSWAWPSFAQTLINTNPEKIVNTVKVIFHSGEIYNFGVKPIEEQSLTAIEPYFTRDESDDRGSFALHLPSCSPATLAS